MIPRWQRSRGKPTDARATPDSHVLTVVDDTNGEVRVRVAGAWRMRDGVPAEGDLLRDISGSGASAVSFDGSGITSWDSSLVTFVYDLTEKLRQAGTTADVSGLPDGVQRLLGLAGVQLATGEAGARPARPILARLGESVLGVTQGLRTELALVGRVTVAFGPFLSGRTLARRADVVLEMQQAGAQALPIVSLVSGLLGMIIAFVGAAAMQPFGTGIYVADIVAVGMVRELAAVGTAIVMAGRTGSSYAAQLATMNLTQEIDALETMAVDPLDFLVLPRMVALSLMMPLLCVYAGFVAIVGGALVAVGMLHITATQYAHETKNALTLSTYFIGTGKSALFGMLVAYLGCRAGLRSRGGASAVGRAATTAMVTAIVAIVVADGILAVIFQVVGI